MKLAFDSSAFTKRYVQEDGTETVESLLYYASDLALCIILVPEIISAFNRRLREKVLSIMDYQKAKRQLLDDVRDATIIQLTPAVISHSFRLLENNVLRAMDALHVACALEWEADLFVTSDKRQFEAAINAGLHSKYIQTLRN